MIQLQWHTKKTLTGASEDGQGSATCFAMKRASRVLLMSCVLLHLSFSIQLSGQPKTSPGLPEAIAVRLLLDKKIFSVGQSIKVVVEISNQIGQPVVVSNVVTMVGDSTGHIEFKVTDASGNESPIMRLIPDSFSGSHVPENSWSSVLGRWLVLYPGYAVRATLPIDKALFPFLDTPGRYKLEAAYSSGGLSYPANYRQLGITDKDVVALPYSSWSGKVYTNSVWITIVPKKVLKH